MLSLGCQTWWKCSEWSENSSEQEPCLPRFFVVCTTPTTPTPTLYPRWVPLHFSATKVSPLEHCIRMYIQSCIQIAINRQMSYVINYLHHPVWPSPWSQSDLHKNEGRHFEILSLSLPCSTHVNDTINWTWRRRRKVTGGVWLAHAIMMSVIQKRFKSALMSILSHSPGINFQKTRWSVYEISEIRIS